MTESCIFCGIAERRIPSTPVMDSPRLYAFRDVNPVAPQHILIIPKEHVAESLADLTDHSLLADIGVLAQKIASELGLEGWRLVTNVGREAGQSVFHLHFHLLSGRPFSWPPG
jgi:histidine triad (HIT) family protein